MQIDDRLEILIQRISKESELGVFSESLQITLALIPFGIGSTITTILSGHAKRLIFERMTEVFRIMKDRIEEAGESKIDKAFFEGSEFQTLLALSLQQLHTTHDKAKIEMIARGLANSGTYKFSADERKEVFTSILRDLSSMHIRFMLRILPKGESLELLLMFRSSAPDFSPHNPESVAIVHSLLANGLVDQLPITNGFSVSSELDYERGIKREQWEKKVEEFLERAATPRYRITAFGLDFLEYFGLLNPSAEHDIQA